MYPDLKDKIAHMNNGEGKHSLKSQRGSVSRPKEEAITVWTCPKCSLINPLSEKTHCSNTKNCDFDITEGEIDAEFSEMTQE